jgi:hypothetical protein
MDEIIVAVLIALLAGFALFDVIRFVQSFEPRAVWKFLLGVGLPCAFVAYLVISLGFLEISSNATPLSRSAALERRCAELHDSNCFWDP